MENFRDSNNKNHLISNHDKIFIAGHKGLVGKSLTRKFKQYGFNNLVFADRKNLDLRDSNKVLDWFQINKPNVVIIAAAKVGGIKANNNFPVDFLLDNIKIQNNLIETSWKIGVRRLLFLGSSCIYPRNAKQPMTEDLLLTSNLEKTNEFYAIAKICGLKLCEALHKQYGFDAISLMPCNLYGPGDYYHPENSHVIPSLIRRFDQAYREENSEVICWGTGNVSREFLHVDDLSEACIFALKHWKISSTNAPKDEKGKPLLFLNVGTGKEIKLKDLAQIISREIKFKGIISWDHSKPDGTPRKVLNIDKLKSLGWISNIELKVGIKDSIFDYQNNTVRM